MLKIFSTEQIRRADAYTIQNEPVASIDLMERAALACVNWLKTFQDIDNKTIIILCGPGNNGGDGLAIARIMHKDQKKVIAYIPDDQSKRSDDFNINLKRADEAGVCLKHNSDFQFSELSDCCIIIDALFGSGLSKPLEGIYAEIVRFVNISNSPVISIDIPSGLYADKAIDNKHQSIIRADYTLSFQFPKISFLFPENELFAGNWQILPIGLHPDFITQEPCKNFLIEHSDIKAILKPRPRFSHKGIFGHALMIGGSKGMIGAAVLMSKSCLRSGTGIVTVHIPACGYPVIQTAVPEALVSTDDNENKCTHFPQPDKFTAVAAGPGIGRDKSTATMLKHLIQEVKSPLVLDADAINILSENPTWLAFLPKGTILTPHPGEFERLAGRTTNSFDRLDRLKEICIKYSIHIVMKGAYSITCTTLGNCYFNTSGNSGISTAGSGDVLTGVITGLLAQGYHATEACILGVYLHGRAGDIAAGKRGVEALIAGDIIENLGEAFKELY